MRRMIDFECTGDALVGTLDEGQAATGLLIVSGGNEIRSGAYAGQAMMAGLFATMDIPVFRYDRRGIGDSEGANTGFGSSADDIAAAIAAFREAAPHITRIVAFGNCDAASALALYHHGLGLDALVLANPWVIETTKADDSPTPPSASAIRARYWARIKNPRSLIDLLTGKIDLKKLAGGLVSAAQKSGPNGLADRIAAGLAAAEIPIKILIARRDTTAMAFMGVWNSVSFARVRQRDTINLASIDTASHSFVDVESKSWLQEQIAAELIPQLHQPKSQDVNNRNGSEGGT
jgi:exosortase A-associated hydrolase 1